MTETSPAAPARLERRARRMKRVNIPIRFVLGFPFPTPLSSRLMLVSYTGRKTGRAYRQPVSYVRDDDILLTPGGGKWKLNLRAGEPVTIRLQGHDVTARPEFVRNAGEVGDLLHDMMARNPRLTSFVPFIRRDGAIDRGELENALTRGFCIVRWRLDRALARR
jgi:deazaflavin-dependent oxidoreductase (nitroreductase family)